MVMRDRDSLRTIAKARYRGKAVLSRRRPGTELFTGFTKASPKEIRETTKEMLPLSRQAYDQYASRGGGREG